MARQYLCHNGMQIPLNGQDFWVGTHAEFESANPPIPKGTLLYFTDGEVEEKIKVTTVSVSKTISANDDYGITIPNESGYIPIGCFLDESDTARASCLLGNPIHGTTITVRLKNLTGASVSVNATLYVTWVKAV